MGSDQRFGRDRFGAVGEEGEAGVSLDGDELDGGSDQPGGARAHLVSLGRDVSIYGVGGALVQVVGVVTVPVFARQLGAAEYGRLELLSAMTALIVTGCGDAVGSGTMRGWVDQRVESGRRAVLSAGLVLGIILSILGAGLVFLARPILGGSIESGALLAAAVGVPPAVIARLWADVFRVQRRRAAFLVTSICRGLLSGVIGVALVVAARASAASVLLGAALGSSIAVAVALVLGGRALWSRRFGVELRPILHFGLPLIPVAVAGWSLMLSDRLIIARIEPAIRLGEYAVANRVTSVILLVVYSLGTAWTPYALSLGTADPESERRIRPIVMRAVLLLVGVVAIALSSLAPEVVRLAAGSDYRHAAPVIPLLAVSLLGLATVPVSQVPLLLGKRTREMAWVSVAGGVVNLVAAVALVRMWGIDGAAVAAVLGFGVQAIGYLWRGQRVLPSPFNWGQLGLGLGVSVMWLVVLRQMLVIGTGPWARVGFALLYPLVVLALRVVTPQELRSLVKRSPRGDGDLHPRG